MYRKQIAINPSEPDKPLTPAAIRCGSYAQFIFSGLPEGCQSAFIALTPPLSDTPVSFTAVISGTTATVTIAGEVFSAVGSGTYELIFADADGNVFSAGVGTLIVQASALSGEISPMVPAYDPVTHLFHTVYVQTNAQGEKVLALSQIGVSHV